MITVSFLYKMKILLKASKFSFRSEKDIVIEYYLLISHSLRLNFMRLKEV